MKQTTFASIGFDLVIKRTRKREFLDEMKLVVPWTELTGLIQSFAPASKTGRPPFTYFHNASHPFHAAVVWPV